jgi:hypothetical protein
MSDKRAPEFLGSETSLPALTMPCARPKTTARPLGGYMHLNPVRRGVVKRPEQWKWSGFPEYAGVDAAEQESRCRLTIYRVRLPADERAI